MFSCNARQHYATLYTVRLQHAYNMMLFYRISTFKLLTLEHLQSAP